MGGRGRFRTSTRLRKQRFHLHYPKTLVAERGAIIHLAYHKGIEGMAGIGAAPPRAAAGMGEGSTLSGGNLTAAELEYVAVHIV